MPEEKQEQPQEDASQPTAPKGSKMKKLIVFGGLILLVAGGTGGGVFIGMKMAGSQGAPQTEESAADEIVHDIESQHGDGHESDTEHGSSSEAKSYSRQELLFSIDRVTTNLKDPSHRWFCALSLDIEAASPRLQTQLMENEAPLRDATIMLLSSKTREELDTPAGKERFKRELKARIEGELQPNAVNDIYITDITIVAR